MKTTNGRRSCTRIAGNPSSGDLFDDQPFTRPVGVGIRFQTQVANKWAREKTRLYQFHFLSHVIRSFFGGERASAFSFGSRMYTQIWGFSTDLNSIVFLAYSSGGDVDVGVT